MEIVQNEEYLQDVDFDEIKRYDVQKRIGNLKSQKLNLRKGHKHKGKNPRKHPEKNYRKKSGKIPEKILGGEFDPKIVHSREKRYYDYDSDSDYSDSDGFSLSDDDSDDSSDDDSDDDSNDEHEASTPWSLS